MFTSKTVLLTAAALAMASPFASAHYDFVPGIAGGQIVTGGHDDEAGSDVTSLVVAGYDFGEIPEDPYNIGDPGFNTGGPSAFAGSSTLRLTSLPVEGRYLSYWDGTGEASFGALPAGVTLSLSGSPTRNVTLTETTATYTPSSTPSLSIGTFSASGAMHVHLGSSIFANGLQLPDSVPVGAYLISFELSNPGGAATSDPLFIVFNNGLDEEVHDAAIAHVESTYAAAVPEPGTVGLLATGLIGLVARRRRRRTD